MLFARPLTDADRPATPLWLDTVVVKLADVDTRTLYDVAPVAVLQFRVTAVNWFVTLFEGDASTGAPGNAMIVVKLQMLDHAPVPSTFVAFTSQ